MELIAEAVLNLVHQLGSLIRRKFGDTRPQILPTNASFQRATLRSSSSVRSAAGPEAPLSEVRRVGPDLQALLVAADIRLLGLASRPRWGMNPPRVTNT
jgi:hypothetical protein